MKFSDFILLEQQELTEEIKKEILILVSDFMFEPEIEDFATEKGTANGEILENFGEFYIKGENGKLRVTFDLQITKQGFIIYDREGEVTDREDNEYNLYSNSLEYQKYGVGSVYKGPDFIDIMKLKIHLPLRTTNVDFEMKHKITTNRIKQKHEPYMSVYENTEDFIIDSYDENIQAELGWEDYHHRGNYDYDD